MILSPVFLGCHRDTSFVCDHTHTLQGHSRELKPLIHSALHPNCSQPQEVAGDAAWQGHCHTTPSQSEGLLLDLCTINGLLMGERSICRNNLYLSSLAQLKAEPGALRRAPQQFFQQDPSSQYINSCWRSENPYGTAEK